ncbi:TetR/AcrR family transcriptional regulator [Salininema proteolyticum]|uniref:TetR/AcrR family transcriptional regulator n=1 Tax=Salininema proteolyticum TaxID=1607685 RepID=A0ABV8U0G4_9ACTN
MSSEPAPPTPAASDGAPSSRLTEGDWVEAANDILVEENVRGVKLERLCRRLGVTKGSFYWHFKRRADLLTAILSAWRKRTTLDTISRLTAEGARSRLSELLRRPRRPRAARPQAIEASIRDWARNDPVACEALTEVDAIRMEFFRRIFLDEGFSEREAETRAYTAYCLMMGDSVLNKSLANRGGDFAKEAVELLLSKDPRPESEAG